MYAKHQHQLEKIFNAAIAAVQPEVLMRDHVQIKEKTIQIGASQILLSDINNIYIAGAGKAAAAMAKTIENILGPLVTEGIVIVKEGHCVPLNRVQCLEAAHPVPDERGVQGAAAIVKLFQKAGKNDLVIFLLSGGASSLVTDIPEGCTLEELKTVFSELLGCGATIHEMNTVRKHLSLIKGGQLAGYCKEAILVTLIISDVPGNDLSVIGSGPTVPDTSTYSDAINIINKYSLKLPENIIQYLLKGMEGVITETPSSISANSFSYIIGDNSVALHAAEKTATDLGFHSILVNDILNGDVMQAAEKWMQVISAYHSTQKICLITGGETTVQLKGNGRGGRNQQFALAAATQLQSFSNTALLAAGTDGTDGPTDAAGAFVHTKTLHEAEQYNLKAADHLYRNDAYHYFEKLDALFKPGPTHTNVMDIVITLIN